MNKRRLLGLVLFANIVIAGLFFGTELLIDQSDKAEKQQERVVQNSLPENNREPKNNVSDPTGAATDEEPSENNHSVYSFSSDINPTQAIQESQLIEEAVAGFATDVESAFEEEQEEEGSEEESQAILAETISLPQLIYDSTQVDYLSYLPQMQYDSELSAALDIINPDISIDAEAAILFDADTKKVLYYKNAVQPVFPASTLKLLTALVALEWCNIDEIITVGDEINMIASDSTRAFLKTGERLSLECLLEGMLLPSGNDAAYAVAAYVGRKSLDDPFASREESVVEFTRLMNEKANEIGVKNSCFKTPDGYDAIGQYTTAYDMGLIGLEAACCDTIVNIAGKSSARAIFESGEDITWDSTNKLICKYSGKYYSRAIGLKTGTSTMAGRCIIAAARYNGRKVVCAILNSTSSGRWNDATTLMNYGLE